VFLHWDETLNVSTADGTRLFMFDQIFAAVMTDAQMRAWHNHRVLLCVQTDQALIRLRLLYVHLHLAVSSIVLLLQSVDRLDFEGHTIN
jgi:hypothetical protein